MRESRAACHAEELAFIAGCALADGADRNLRAAVERIHRIGKRPGEFIVLRHGDSEEITRATRLERVDHPERQHVVNIVPDIGIENKWKRLNSHCRPWCNKQSHEGQCRFHGICSKYEEGVSYRW